ncbi:hypothetical protein PSP6_270105 [Paraburkholderia tropica]|nr:hypothetical protein PSP6_270105 [Paraburkholderia tropica]
MNAGLAGVVDASGTRVIDASVGLQRQRIVSNAADFDMAFDVPRHASGSLTSARINSFAIERAASFTSSADVHGPGRAHPSNG